MNFQKIKGNKLFRWANSNTKGSVEFFYASFYDGKNQLELKPTPLRHKRIKCFGTSITNPEVFNRFFDLALTPNKVVYSDFIINSLFDNPIVLNDSANYQMISSNPYIESAQNDLDFSLNDIFFKIDCISYVKVA